MIDVLFKPEGLYFAEYDYPGASVFPSGLVQYDIILDADPFSAPPEVRTRNREILFVPATLHQELSAAMEQNKIPLVHRVDLWGLILEPFLDLELSEDQNERIFDELALSGVMRNECIELREEHGACMDSYNIDSGLWDWYHLGLADLLDARRGKLAAARFRYSDEEFRQFYVRAMGLAFRGRVLPTLTPK